MGRAGPFLKGGRLPKAAEQQDLPLTGTKTGTSLLGGKHWQSLPPPTAGRARQPGWCVHQDQVQWYLVLLSPWVGFVPAPTVATLSQHSGISHMVSGSGLVLSLLSRGSDFLPEERGFLFKIQYSLGHVTANIQDLLSWVSTLNFFLCCWAFLN